jgi:hypothetical protein
MRLRAIVLLLTALLPACAALQDTPRQAKAREEWKQCEGSVVGVRISRVEADGRTWFSYDSPSALAAAQACIAQVRAKNTRPGPAVSTAAQAAPPSRPAATELSVWGYTTVSETMETFNLVAYAHSKIECGRLRASPVHHGIDAESEERAERTCFLGRFHL